MALYPNGQRVLTYPGRHMAGALVACGAMQYGGIRGARLNRFVSGTYSNVVGAVPSGYGQGAWLMAVKAGGIAGFSGLTLTPAGSGVLGLPTSGGASLTISFADADGQLISSGNGAASLTFTVADALLVASLGGSGSAALVLSTNIPTLGAEASLTASGAFSITGTLQPYAVGQMSGSTVDNTVLTSTAIAAEVWNSIASAYNDSGTMGSKLNTASSGGVDMNALAQAVWENASRTLTSGSGLTLQQFLALKD